MGDGFTGQKPNQQYQSTEERSTKDKANNEVIRSSMHTVSVYHFNKHCVPVVDLQFKHNSIKNHKKQ